MQLRHRFSTPSVTLAALIFANLIPFSAGARVCNTTNELPCEVSIPLGTFWWNYFDSAGNSLNFGGDDECGMRPAVDVDGAREGATWVAFDVPFMPHRVTYEMFVKSDPLFTTMPGKIVILDMVREADGILNPVLELRLVAKTDVLELVVYSDDGPVELTGGAISPEGSHVTVELTKSLGPDTGDGRARLRIDSQPTMAMPCVGLWENLPNRVRLGVVAVESSSPMGNLEFQPLGFSHQFFATPE